jgi:hypothetical protein
MQGGLGEECLILSYYRVPYFLSSSEWIRIIAPFEFRIFYPCNLDIGNAHETELMALAARWSAMNFFTLMDLRTCTFSWTF